MDELKLVVSNNNSYALNFVDYPIPICSSLIAPSGIDNLNNDVEVWKNLQIFSPLLDEFAITQFASISEVYSRVIHCSVNGQHGN